MNNVVKIENLKDLIIKIRSVLPDSDIAQIHVVETKRISATIKNNSDKFPAGYIIELDKSEWDFLRSKLSTSMKGSKVKFPRAFTEKIIRSVAGMPS